MAIDFVGPLPEDQGFNSIVTMMDRLGADIHIARLNTNITAEKFVQVFFDQWYCAKTDCRATLLVIAITFSYQNSGRHYMRSQESN